MPSHSPEDIQSWDRWFAVECNNHAWDAADAVDPSDEDAVEAMVRCAFASAYHWARAGDTVNLLRADQLLAWVHAVARRLPAAERYAASSQAYLNQGVGGIGDWDRIFQALVQAMISAIAGEKASADSAIAQADALASDLDHNSREIFDKYRAAVRAAG
ncbi:hypothetical protein [Algisphaera agarilytica]|uniref:Uncharacterized protein n=1 Tax=Algisphaera agarilytica TaxID=1385975 RepID=A0A7X0H6C2_9BACT|nr:hypothetical protein [Algisphaera agarilytica]MBB6428635.1 hypothetical protein [Algisphaera agarilytica]